MNPFMLPLAAFALVSSPAPARSIDWAGVDCPRLYDVAENMMRSRQVGVPLPKILELLNKQPSRWQSLFKLMALDAYGRPKYYSQEVQRDATRDFANEWATECYTRQSGLRTTP